MYNDLKNKFGISYILTRKLNQDVVENLFSFLKGMSGSASHNITPLDFKYRSVFIFICLIKILIS